MELENRNLQMAIHMLENILMGNPMEKVNINGLMVAYMKVSLRMEYDVGMEN
jgi:hypothetical protein